MPKLHRNLLSLIFLAALIPALPAKADVFCVTTTAELQLALEQADSNFQDDEIRIAQGTYAVPQATGFTYRGGSEFGGDDNDLTLIGGWIQFGGNPCGRLRSNASALDTLLDGENRHRVMDIVAGNQSKVTISGISFFSGSPSSGDRGGGLSLRTFGADIAEDFTIQRSAFVNNRARTEAAVFLSGAAIQRFVGNLVVGNVAEGQSAAINFFQNDQPGVYVINNTIMNNSSEENLGLDDATGIRVSMFGSAQALVANNILWGNENNDIRYVGDGSITSRNNTIENASGTANVSQNNVSIEPIFESGGFFEFRLVADSALVDIGLNPPPSPVPPIFDLNWSLPTTDVGGQPRITNNGVDLGATETAQDGIFSDRFD
ncbi:hypothetical protein [Wenzhouxiangella marina]|uniref:Uncharacterized protein n=1 Tax=Wenzhouxiangella marina TaxID=1579979 RepID=A0A0K0XZJ0_9GAMM|nr:hypothetical protein [Wenzhouxiangella marina]AKS43052.1 hypothetical protein WM2015_2694 [Wenzhouxiangella marina]MBB6087264.1 hypothetical protein [Wenzhouxiangella marina]